MKNKCYNFLLQNIWLFFEILKKPEIHKLIKKKKNAVKKMFASL